MIPWWLLALTLFSKKKVKSQESWLFTSIFPRRGKIDEHIITKSPEPNCSLSWQSPSWSGRFVIFSYDVTLDSIFPTLHPVVVNGLLFARVGPSDLLPERRGRKVQERDQPTCQQAQLWRIGHSLWIRPVSLTERLLPVYFLGISPKASAASLGWYKKLPFTRA